MKGLVDSDGHIYARGKAEFISTEQRLAAGALELISSLRMKGTIRKGDASGHSTRKLDPYRVRFSPTTCVAFLPRKAETAVEAIRAREADTLSRVQQRYIRSVEDVGTRPVICLSVDSPSGMMLAGRLMIPVKTAGEWAIKTREVTRQHSEELRPDREPTFYLLLEAICDYQQAGASNRSGPTQIRLIAYLKRLVVHRIILTYCSNPEQINDGPLTIVTTGSKTTCDIRSLRHVP